MRACVQRFWGRGSQAAFRARHLSVCQQHMPVPSLDPYDLLGVTQHSTCQEVRKRYYSLACLCHPDRGGTNEQMQTLHNAYQYVIRQVALNRQATFEELEADFANFCASQTATPPPFVDIHAEAFNLPRFNELFDLRVGTSTEVDGAFADGGYAVVPSDITLEYRPHEANTVPMFTTEMVVYEEPAALVMPRETVRDLTGTPLEDYGCSVGRVRAADYRVGLSAPHLLRPEEPHVDVLTAYHRVMAERATSARA